MSNYPDGMDHRHLDGDLEVICPACHGDGLSRSRTGDDCDMCNGAGEIDDETAEVYNAERQADDVLDDRAYWSRRG